MCAHWRRPNHAACAEGHTKAVDSAPQVTPARRERVCKPRAERHLPLVGSAVALLRADQRAAAAPLSVGV